MGWKKLSDQMSFGNPGLQFWFFLSYMKINASTGAGFGAWLGVTEAEYLNRHHLHPFSQKQLNICLP